MNLIQPALDWATANGPPNYIFLIALLSSPFLWAGYVKNFLKNIYESRFGSD